MSLGFFIWGNLKGCTLEEAASGLQSPASAARDEGTGELSTQSCNRTLLYWMDSHQYAVFKSDKNITSFNCLTIRFPRTQSDTANTAEHEGIWFQALSDTIKLNKIKQHGAQSMNELVELSQWRAHAIQNVLRAAAEIRMALLSSLYVSKHKWIKGFLCCATHVHAPTVDTLTRVTCIYRRSCIIHVFKPGYILIINLCVCLH